ncbi:glucosamine-6-phosphate deaminase [Calothrix sp. UHCC 0171]|uniref:glucosamine-6-phosphate deaminase n=1 Tax=Calothrix sp. UHCC 0171 TaxID=3110245 RepID=UPI002B210473|nr:glucosamine-6-phosphate deaminase [Calothrix sp. UHCC 0171]MEA5570781.1 glucosamine-6-phosphate deaminase [Calothrix sp. UHCC 0171]
MIAPKHNFRVDQLQVNIYNSEAEIAQGAAEIVSKYLHNLLLDQEKVRVLLATGNSQLQFLEALIAINGFDWSRVTCFHLDEYLGISAHHAASFRYYLREKVEKRVHPQEFNYIQGDTLQPLAECDRYSQLLQAQPIDLCLLGIGENGHLAFNEPSVANFTDPYGVKIVKLDELNRQQQVNTGYFAHVENVPQYAFTVTIPMICASKKIICLAPGQRKAEIIRTMLQGEITEACPASILRQQQQASLLLDVDSASLDINNPHNA